MLQSKHTINLIWEKELIGYTSHFSQRTYRMQYFFLLLLVVTLMSSRFLLYSIDFFGDDCNLNG